MSALSILPAPMSRKGFVLMIHLFLDDSGKESQPTMPYVCMGGYLFSVEAMISLNQKWQMLLIKHSITEIHMKQIIPIEGQYKRLGWNHDKRNEVLAEFIDVIRDVAPVGVGVAVEMKAWRAAKKARPEANLLGTAHQFCLERVMRRTIELLHEANVNEHLSLVFDTDPEFGATRFGTFCALMGHDQRASRRLSSITFGHPQHYPGLQCADLLAWETRKELLQKRDGYTSTRRWDAMFGNFPHYRLPSYVGELWGSDEFDRAFNQLAISSDHVGGELPV